MLFLITPENYHLHREDLDNMYRLRHKVFYEKLEWDVASHNGMEKDSFDEKNAYYIIYKDTHGTIRGCVRFIEMTHECMFDNQFSFSLPNFHKFKRPGYWEVSRMAVDCEHDENYQKSMSREVCITLLAGYTYFGLEFDVECSLIITYPSVIKLYKKYGLILSQIHESHINNEEIIVSAYIPLNYCYDELVQKINLDTSKPILWHNGGMYKDTFISEFNSICL